jgi:uncharacterized membrane protein
MEQLNQVETSANTEEDEEHIHMPAPSWAPIILALGMAGVCFGVVLSALVLAIGVVLLLLGLGLWVFEDIKNASQVDTDDQVSQSAV